MSKPNDTPDAVREQDYLALVNKAAAFISASDIRPASHPLQRWMAEIAADFILSENDLNGQMSVSPNTQEPQLLRLVAGCLKTCIDNHGDITLATRGSAAKRVVKQLKAYVSHDVLQQLAALRAENERYRKALEHYADADNWDESDAEGSKKAGLEPIQDLYLRDWDGTFIAREALKRT